MEEQLVCAMESLDEAQVIYCVKTLLEENISTREIQKLLNEGMKRVGRLFEKGEYFLADLIVSGLIYQKALTYFPVSHSADSGAETIGTVLCGVMKDDIHDIGKDIVCSTLRAEGFKVIDLGTDVDTEQFIRTAQENKPDIIALSGVMSYCVAEMKETITALRAAGIDKYATIIVGGNCMTSETSKYIGADAYSQDPIETAVICKSSMKAKRYGKK